jgi:hypothetical protein
MKRIEWIWNLIFYSMYRWEVKFNRLLNYINPFFWMNKISSVKERRARYGVDDMNQFKDNLLNNPKTGLGLYPIYVSIGGLFVIFELSLFNFILLLFKYPLSNILESTLLELIILGVLFIVAVGFNQIMLYNDDKYLDYFEKFNKLSSKRQFVNGLISVVMICIIILLFFITLSAL